MSESHRPRGFRLIDLMVGIFVIAVLLTLGMMLTPFGMSGTNCSRTGQCQNNLKNIVLGLAQYSMAQGVYPNSGTFFDDPAMHQGDPLKSNIYKSLTDPSAFATGMNPCRSNWVVAILPYLDQQEHYNAWNFNDSYLSTQRTGWMPVNNVEIANISNGLLKCPDDQTAIPSQGNLSYVVNGGFSRWHVIPLSWTGSPGTPASGPMLEWTPSRSSWQTNQAEARKLGVMFLGTHTGDQPWDIKTTPADIVDGASTTILVGESTFAGYSTGTPYSGGLPTNWACPLPTFAMFMGSDNVCHSSKSTTDCLGGQLAPTAKGENGLGWALANRSGTGEGINDFGSLTVAGSFPYANSGHQNLVNFAFCDGPVKALRPSINGSVYASLLTPAGTQLPAMLRQSMVGTDDFDTP